ncbi:cytidine deaminase [Aciduliprofundum sp. MAR08-339]|uniref:cytidine deaminase n=1 Tax=Aciduliprofundum sp. (strain MAR08-339) TaxID=673860 RepID=UPI00064FD5E2
MDTNNLIEMAKKAREKAYAPYSNFRVGAAVVACGKVFTGCNVENASYGLTICAERVAIFKAISEGCRNIERIAIYAENMPYPCGACLQVMDEFCKDNCQIIISDGKRVEEYSFRDLLPRRFSLQQND